MKPLRGILGLALVAGLVTLVWWHFFPNEDRRVRKLFAHLAQAASIPNQRSPARMVLSLDRLSGYFSRDVQATLDVPIEGRHSFSDRAELMEAMKAAWASVRGVTVEFLDLTLTFDAPRENATADLTVRVTQTGQKDFWVQEMRFQLRKQEGDWRITHFETVRTLQQ